MIFLDNDEKYDRMRMSEKISYSFVILFLLVVIVGLFIVCSMPAPTLAQTIL